MEERAVLGHHPFETIENGADLLELRQLAPGDHKEMATAFAKSLHGRGR